MEHKMRAITPDHNQIRCEVVTTYEQMLHAYAIRSICFMEEHGVKARQTFDGNDYQSTHMIAYAGDEPVGTLRIRWFKDFAKIERVAVPRSRTANIAHSEDRCGLRVRSRCTQGLR